MRAVRKTLAWPAQKTYCASGSKLFRPTNS